MGFPIHRGRFQPLALVIHAKGHGVEEGLGVEMRKENGPKTYETHKGCMTGDTMWGRRFRTVLRDHD